MIKTYKRIAAGLLALVVLLTTSSCKSKLSPKQDGLPSGDAAMGRYIEEEYELPENIGYVQMFKQRDDGVIELLCNSNPDTALGPWSVFTSADGGKTWTKKDTPWISELDNAVIQGADYAKDGSLHIAYLEYPAEVIEMVKKGEQPQEEPQSKQFFMVVDAAGKASASEKQLPKDESMASISNIKVADNGDYVFYNYFSLNQVDPNTMKVKNTFTPNSVRQLENYLVFGNTLVQPDGDSVVLFDLETGKNLATIPISADNADADSLGDAERLITVSDDNKALYLCDNTGIYRRLLDGNVFEKVVDGELTSLNMPSLTRRNMIVQKSGDILVLSQGDEGYVLLNYSYSKDVPTVPTTELKVYSLQNNKTIRQAMGLYQRANPDVHVSYTVGLTGSDAVTASDALRSLSTELLAGKGPDFLVLDGMPIESYIQKGILLDLGNLVNEPIAKGEYLPNVAKTYQLDDGKLPAIPARFGVPVMQGDDGAFASIHNLDTLTEYLVNAKIDANKQRVLASTYPETLIRQFYPVCAPAWFAQDGTIRADALSDFIKQMKKISDTEVQNEYSNEKQFEIRYDAMDWKYNAIQLNIGTLQSHNDIAAPEAAIRDKGQGKLAPLPGQTDNVYVPQTVLGINANSAQQQKAIQFLNLVLSEQIQDNNFFDGFPVNSASFEKGAKNPYPPNDDGMVYTSSFKDENGNIQEMMELQVIWPSDAYMKDMLNAIRNLNTPCTVDAVLQQILVDETKDYFTGAKSLESTITAVTEKMKLYLAE